MCEYILQRLQWIHSNRGDSIYHYTQDKVSIVHIQESSQILATHPPQDGSTLRICSVRVHPPHTA